MFGIDSNLGESLNGVTVCQQHFPFVSSTFLPELLSLGGWGVLVAHGEVTSTRHVFDIRLRICVRFPHKSWRYIKEKTFNPDNTTEFSGARKAATRELFWAANFVVWLTWTNLRISCP